MCHNGKLPEWELRFNPHDLPVFTTKRENRVYPDKVKEAAGCARLSLTQIEALHVTGRLCNASVACNTLSVQATTFHRTDRSISDRKYYKTLKATALDPPGIRFA
jgi:hypothetical protein